MADFHLMPALEILPAEADFFLCYNKIHSTNTKQDDSIP